MQYWFNVDTKEVEAHDDPERARSASLLGPYDSQVEAQQALERAAQRTKEWDEQDDWGVGSEPDADD